MPMKYLTFRMDISGSFLGLFHNNSIEIYNEKLKPKEFFPNNSSRGSLIIQRTFDAKWFHEMYTNNLN